jgi:hypothetical protein
MDKLTKIRTGEARRYAHTVYSGPFVESDALSLAKAANNEKVAQNLREGFPSLKPATRGPLLRTA